MVKVKICGIKKMEDAQWAVNAGANALGFIFAESKRKIDPQKVKEIIKNIPPFITTIGVFVNEDKSEVQRIARFCQLDMVQLHGQESPEYCHELNLKVIKGFQIKDKDSLEALNSYKGAIKGLLLDTFVPGMSGGTGETFDWSLAKEAKNLGPIILAGGLNPSNVTMAIETAQPYAVDVSSGVETNGVKDAKKIKSFIDAVRRTNYDAR